MKITRRQIRRIIKEYSARRNAPPPRNSNWRALADVLDVGVLDLDEIAYDLGFRDFLDMDISITPRRLSQRDPTSFVTAIRNHALAGSDMTDDDIMRAADYEAGLR